MHSGTAMGGHYYAYIQDLRAQRWLEFNDSVVRELAPGSMETAHGASSEKSGSSAYMLLYRRSGADIPPFSIPTSIQEIVRVEDEKFLKEKAEYERNRDSWVSLCTTSTRAIRSGST